MRLYFCFLFLWILQTQTSASAQAGDKLFTKKVIAENLDDPWTVICGPDQHLWITEAKGYRVIRINPQTGSRDTLVDLNSLRKFPRYDTLNDDIDGGKPWPQAGLMGMALHPLMLQGKPFVYLAYLYDFEGINSPGNGQSKQDGGFHFLTRVVRYRY